MALPPSHFHLLLSVSPLPTGVFSLQVVTVRGISSTSNDQHPKNDSVTPVPSKKKSSFFRRVFLKQPVRQCFHPGAGNFGGDTMQGKFRKGEDKESVSTGEIIKALAGYIWPPGEHGVRARVTLAFGLLVGAKLINTSVPVLFKQAVDSLGMIQGADMDVAAAASATALSLVVGYSAARSV